MKFSVLFTVLGFSVFSFAAMLHVKTDVGRLLNERDHLLSDQAFLRETMKVQKAELAHLTSPDRLEKYADLAGMVTIDVRQISPMRASYVLGGGQP